MGVLTGHIGARRTLVWNPAGLELSRSAILPMPARDGGGMEGYVLVVRGQKGGVAKRAGLRYGALGSRRRKQTLVRGQLRGKGVPNSSILDFLCRSGCDLDRTRSGSNLEARHKHWRRATYTGVRVIRSESARLRGDERHHFQAYFWVSDGGCFSSTKSAVRDEWRPERPPFSELRLGDTNGQHGFPHRLDS